MTDAAMAVSPSNLVAIGVLAVAAIAKPVDDPTWTFGFESRT
jgi:hypothetical protein